VIPAGVAHAAALAAVHETAFPPSDRWDSESFAHALSMPGCFAFLDPRGGMVMARVAADEAEILTLAVAPPVRRQGTGRRLLSAVVAEAVARGARVLFLEVSECNEAARLLYSHTGFTQVGRRNRYYADGSAALVLSINLSSATN
jgi:ribosomal-protein-alanine N-acetyltransferase